MSKKYGGVIDGWSKMEIDADRLEQITDKYGPNLGFMIRGTLGRDPTNRGFGYSPIRTSLVVKFSDNQIETLNTIYDLGAPHRGQS